MSFDAIKWVVSLRLKPLPKSVLLSLADRARVINGALVCYPSYERIAADNCISLRTAKEAVSDLVDMGVLSTEKRADKGGHRSSNVYILNITKVQDLHSGKFHLSADSSIQSAHFALRTISENFDPKAASDKALDSKNQSADFARESLNLCKENLCKGKREIPPNSLKIDQQEDGKTEGRGSAIAAGGKTKSKRKHSTKGTKYQPLDDKAASEIFSTIAKAHGATGYVSPQEGQGLTAILQAVGEIEFRADLEHYFSQRGSYYDGEAYPARLFITDFNKIHTAQINGQPVKTSPRVGRNGAEKTAPKSPVVIASKEPKPVMDPTKPRPSLKAMALEEMAKRAAKPH
jgi:hypothetical protein